MVSVFIPPYMRILQVIDQLNVGGAERVLVDLSNILYEHGHSIEVLSLVRPGKLRDQLHYSIPFLNLDRINKFNFITLYRCHLVCSRFDIVHVHLRYNYRYVALAKWIFRGKYLLVLHDHDGELNNLPIGLKFFLRRNGWYLGVCKPIVNWAIKNAKLEQTHVYYLPNIVVKKETSISSTANASKIRIVLVSNFRTLKNHSFAIQLLTHLKCIFDIDVRFIGTISDENYLNSLVKLTKEVGLESSLIFDYNCDDVQGILNKYDLAIHTSFQESGPLVLIEYLAQQLPFVAYKTGEVATQIQQVIPEFFVEDFEIAHWIDRIKFVLENKDSFSPRMASAFESLYSSEAYYQKCLAIYNCMLHGEQR